MIDQGVRVVVRREVARMECGNGLLEVSVLAGNIETGEAEYG